MFPQAFDPTAGETVSIRYWANQEAAANVTLKLQSDPNKLITLPLHRATVGATHVRWDGKNNTGLIASRGDHDLSLSLENGAGNTTTESHPSAVALTYPIESRPPTATYGALRRSTIK
ncbi:MAG: hypothetical protein GY809_19645 [Planctomycetes bacterium]|nr:hypothetical protein [Planctomycetota bacterium]